METTSGHEIDQVLERFRQGQLTEQSFREALERHQTAPKRQDLLYLEARTTSLTSNVLGMNLVRNGEVVDARAPPGNGPIHPCWRPSATAGASSSFLNWPYCWWRIEPSAWDANSSSRSGADWRCKPTIVSQR